MWEKIWTSYRTCTENKNGMDSNYIFIFGQDLLDHQDYERMKIR